MSLLLERGYTACEIDFEGKFWMDYPWAERFGELARENDIALSVHAPIAGFMGHLERGKKYNMATGMLDHSAGVAVALRRRARGLPPGLSPRPGTRGRARVRRRPARLAARAAGGQGSRRPLRHRGDGPRPRPREPRRRPLDRRARRVGASGDRLRAHARDLRRRLRRGRRAFAEALDAGGRRAGGRRTVPHPLLRHRVREPQRDEAPPLRRGHAPRRATRARLWHASIGRRRSSRSRRTRSRARRSARSCSARASRGFARRGRGQASAKMALQLDRMRENEELFRMANERLRQQVAGSVTADRLVPFVCECADEPLPGAGRDDARRPPTRARGTRTRSQSRPATPPTEGEVVVQEYDSFHVVRKEAA